MVVHALQVSDGLGLRLCKDRAFIFAFAAAHGI